MPQFYIVSESTEDTLATAETLGDAIRAGREFAKQVPVGDLVSVLESSGVAVRQFAHLPNGAVTEQVISTQTANLAAIPLRSTTAE